MALVCFKVEDLGMEYRDVQKTVPLNMFVSLCQSEIVPFFHFIATHLLRKKSFSLH